MKKLYVLLLACSCILLVGCFKKQNPPVDTDMPVIVDQEETENEEIENEEQDMPDSEGDEQDNRANEYDENGEFDPSKFEDEDIQEIMDIMKELIQE